MPPQLSTAIPLTKDELTVQIEALREYRLRLNVTDSRRTVSDMLIYRLGAALVQQDENQP